MHQMRPRQGQDGAEVDLGETLLAGVSVLTHGTQDTAARYGTACIGSRWSLHALNRSYLTVLQLDYRPTGAGIRSLSQPLPSWRLLVGCPGCSSLPTYL